MTDEPTRSSELVREDEARALIEGIEDQACKNLVTVLFAAARMRVMPWRGLSETDRVERMPVAPFDMEFFVRVATEVLSRREVVDRILRGETIAAATGWDI